jgi:hypothetical protein
MVQNPLGKQFWPQNPLSQTSQNLEIKLLVESDQAGETRGAHYPFGMKEINQHCQDFDLTSMLS